MYRLTSSFRIAALSAALVLGAGNAVAGPRTVTVIAHPETFKERVATADLDLASKAGRRALAHRVSAAAQTVCNPARFKVLLTASEQTDCFAGAIADARPQVAQAIERATQIAENGISAIPAVALAVSAGQ